ncbi:MAG: MFS transporter [Candidatus Moranbacteria bacterium]|nr:MFS transporter [Candidatus Moranbacteria bacterium]MBP6033873.1 MFS transporter [Candidatus Moranbacteria bacterium]MBP7695669.1 MFS transporter [Candidatus Moranbacteria bacterium]
MKKKTLRVLFFTLMLDMIGLGMVIPIIPIIFTDPSSPSFLLQGYSTQGQYIVSGVITALFGIILFFAAPILGELSDVYGRKRLLMVGVGVLAFSQLLFGLGIEIGSLTLLFVSRAVAGLAGANFSIAQASIADVSEPHERAKNFGLIGAAFGIGFILGPVLGGWIAAALHSAAAPFWFSGMLGIVNTLLVMFFLPETRKTSAADRKRFHLLRGIDNIRAAFRDKDASPVYMASFLYISGFSFFTSFIGILLVSRFSQSEAEIGSFFGFVGVWIIVTQTVILRTLSKRYTERTILRISLACLAGAIALYPLAPSVFWVFLLAPLTSIPNGLSMANMSALVSKSVSVDKQGAALGINGSLGALSSGIVPLLAGFGSGFLGLSAPFFVGGLLVAAAWGMMVLNHRRYA